jgi:hypothetical protein
MSTNAGLFPSDAARIQSNPEAYCIQDYTILRREGEKKLLSRVSSNICHKYEIIYLS